MVAPGRLDAAAILDAFAERMMYSVAKDQHTATEFHVYQALACAVRDRLTDRATAASGGSLCQPEDGAT